MIVHIWHWLLDFTGTNNGQNGFATHMYNFWSGFGGGLIQFSLLGVIVGLYRHYLARNSVVKYITKKNPLHKDEEAEADK